MKTKSVSAVEFNKVAKKEKRKQVLPGRKVLVSIKGAEVEAIYKSHNEKYNKENVVFEGRVYYRNIISLVG